MVESVGVNVERRTLNLTVTGAEGRSWSLKNVLRRSDPSVREEEGRSWSLTVPGEVMRGDSLLCRTKKPFLQLKPFSSILQLRLSLSTEEEEEEEEEAQQFQLTVSLESDQFEWEAVADAR